MRRFNVVVPQDDGASKFLQQRNVQRVISFARMHGQTDSRHATYHARWNAQLSDAQDAAVRQRFNGRFVRLYRMPIRPLSLPDSLRICFSVERNRL